MKCDLNIKQSSHNIPHTHLYNLKLNALNSSLKEINVKMHISNTKEKNVRDILNQEN